MGAKSMYRPGAVPAMGLLEMNPHGDLRLANRRLGEGTTLEVWLAGGWHAGQLVRQRGEWAIQLRAGRTVLALGAIARLPTD